MSNVFMTKPDVRLHPQAKAWGLGGKIDNLSYLRQVVTAAYRGDYSKVHNYLDTSIVAQTL